MGTPGPGAPALGAPRRIAAIGFGGGGTGRELLAEGWCAAEPDATWTGAAQCTLRIPLPPAVGDCLLRLRAAPFRAADAVPFQRLGVLGNGMLLARLQFDGGLQAVELLVPAAVTDGAAALTLTLLLPDAARPADVSASPDTRLLALHVHDLELLRLRTEDTALAGPAWPGAAATEEAALLLGFDSLGSDAEFGFVQRRFGAEPAGLFRWADTGAAGLAAALASGLDGLGDPEALDVAVQAGGWVATHRRWGFRRPAGPAVPGLDATAVRTLEARRQAVGRDRLLAGLRAGGRILVYKQRDPAEAVLLPALATALEALGDSWLLWVTPAATTGRAPGAVAALGGRRLLGTLDRFAPAGNLANISADPWLGMCREAHRLSRA